MIRVATEVSDEEFPAAIGKYIDAQAFVRYLAAETFVGDIDGFLGDWGMNNFYLYRHPGATLFTLIARDKDVTFRDAERDIWQGVDFRTCSPGASSPFPRIVKPISPRWKNDQLRRGQGWMARTEVGFDLRTDTHRRAGRHRFSLPVLGIGCERFAGPQLHLHAPHLAASPDRNGSHAASRSRYHSGMKFALLLLAIAASAQTPRYESKAVLKSPDGYRDWYFVGSNLGISYSENATKDPNFKNIYIPRAAADSFKKTGIFPEKTMLVMEVYQPTKDASPAKQGQFEGKFVGIEVAVKDKEAVPEGWAYYNFIGDNGERKTHRQGQPQTRLLELSQ